MKNQMDQLKTISPHETCKFAQQPFWNTGFFIIDVRVVMLTKALERRNMAII